MTDFRVPVVLREDDEDNDSDGFEIPDALKEYHR